MTDSQVHKETSNGRGILYIASGPSFQAEACKSAERIRKLNPSLHITLFTDKSSPALNQNPFNEVREFADAPLSWEIKPRLIAETPYEKTLFLDSDTYAISAINDYFDALELYEMAVVHAPARSTCEASKLPRWFPEVNTGVIAFRRCHNVDTFFQAWQHCQEQLAIAFNRTGVPDQWGFRQALLEHHDAVRYLILAPEYNFRFEIPVSAHGTVRMLHGRASDLETIAVKVNQNLNIRCWFGYLVSIDQKRPILDLLKQWITRKFGRTKN